MTPSYTFIVTSKNHGPHRVIIDMNQCPVVFDGGPPWCLCHHKGVFYVQRQIRGEDGRLHTQQLSHLLMETPPGLFVKHLNDNLLDCRMENMQNITVGQHQAYMPKRAPHSSRYRGVTWARHVQRWKAQISVYKKKFFLGYFDNEAQAGGAYLAARAEYHAAGGLREQMEAERQKEKRRG